MKYTKVSQEEVMKFYRDEYAPTGYTEHESLTVIVETMFNMVPDGEPSGQAVVLQSVNLGNGSRLVAIHWDDIWKKVAS